MPYKYEPPTAEPGDLREQMIKNIADFIDQMAEELVEKALTTDDEAVLPGHVLQAGRLVLEASIENSHGQEWADGVVRGIYVAMVRTWIATTR